MSLGACGSWFLVAFISSLKYLWTTSSAKSENKKSCFGFGVCGHNLKLVSIQSTWLRDLIQLSSATYIIYILQINVKPYFFSGFFQSGFKMDLFLLFSHSVDSVSWLYDVYSSITAFFLRLTIRIASCSFTFYKERKGLARWLENIQKGLAILAIEISIS